MAEIKISLIIPYCNRLDNIKYCLKSINMQSLKKNEYEVIIGCLEYSIELLSFIKNEVPGLNAILVLSSEPWNVSRARNIAIKEARGEVVVFVDADVIIPFKYLELHYQTHKESPVPLFVIGQTRDYDEGMDIEKFKHHPFEFYAENYLSKTIDEIDLPADVRWTIDIYIDWAMGWTFNLSLSKNILENNLFDEDFKGWGVEDIEWAYRVKCAGSKVIFSDKIWAIHLSHYRNVNSNHETERINFKKMLCKWPEFEVELVTTFGDIKGNKAYPKIMENVARVIDDEIHKMGVIEMEDKFQQKHLYIGASIDPYNTKPPLHSDKFTSVKTLSLFGYSLPYQDKQIQSVELSPALSKVDRDLHELILTEVNRITDNIVIRRK